MAIISRNQLPAELTGLPQWVLWRREERDGKSTKVPYQARTRLIHARTDDPRTWATFDLAAEMWQRHKEHVSGVGFVFTADDPYCGIDLDNIWQSDADEGALWAAGILERFADTYSEVSPSGRGFKIWVRAKSPRCGRWSIEHGAIEVYDHRRYFAVTARSNRVLTVTDHLEDIERLVGNLDQDRGGTPKPAAVAGTIPKGRRHPILVSLAGTMWKRGMCAAAVEAALLKTNEEQCDPPYSPDHIHKIVESAGRWKR
jgi:hypothetical protein